MTELTERSGALIVTYSDWVTAIPVLAALGFFILAAIQSADRKKLRNHCITGFIFALAGYYFLTFEIRLNNETGKVYGFIWHDDTIRWADAVRATLVERSGPKSSKTSVYITDRAGREFELPLRGVYGRERQQVLAFVQQRLPVPITRSDE